MLRKLLYFGSNKKSILLLRLPGYRPTRIYAQTKRPFSGYKPWAYILGFTVLWKFIQCTIHWDKTQMLKKFPSNKINVTKNALFFLSRAPTHHSFTLNSRFLYGLKDKIRLSKSVCGIFHFQFRFVFSRVYIFVKQKAWTVLL